MEAPKKIYRTTTYLDERKNGDTKWKQEPVAGAENTEYIRKDVVDEMVKESEIKMREKMIRAAIEWIRRNANIYDFRWVSVFRETMNKVK